MRSISFIAHCVVISPSSFWLRYSGTNSVSGSGAMTTPAAWTEA